MEPMFLPDVEANPSPGPYKDLIEQMRATGAEYPQIWHLFAYLPSATNHLARFTQEIMRGPAPLYCSVDCQKQMRVRNRVWSRRDDAPFGLRRAS